MKWASAPSVYRNCIRRVSVRTGRNFSPALKVLSITLPSVVRLSFVRTNAGPLPGLTCWNSTILKIVPSTSMWVPFLNWLVLITASRLAALRDTRAVPDNVELVRDLYAAWNRGDLAKTAAALDEFVVWDARESPVPDLQGVYQGLAGVNDFWRGWLPMWSRIQAEILWVEALGDRVLAWVHQTQAGRESGIETTVHYGWDFTFREGKIIRVSFFNDEHDARERAGL